MQAMKAMQEEINHLRASVKVRDDLLRTKKKERVNHRDPPGLVLKKSSLSNDSDSEDDDDYHPATDTSKSAKAILSPVPPVLNPISAKQLEQRAAQQACRDVAVYQACADRVADASNRDYEMQEAIWASTKLQEIISTQGALFPPESTSIYNPIAARQREKRDVSLHQTSAERVAAQKKAEHDAWKAKSKAQCDEYQRQYDEAERKQGYKNYSPEFYAAIRKKSHNDAMTAYYQRVAEQDMAKISPLQCPYVSGGTPIKYSPGQLTPHGFRINPHTKFLTTDPDQISHLLSNGSYDTLPPV